MEGSPARGQKLDGLAMLLIDVSDASTVSDFQDRLIQGISSRLQNGKVLVVLGSQGSEELDFEGMKYSDEYSFVSPSWLKSHLERHPELLRKLKKGEMVGITHVEGSTTPQPPSTLRNNVLMLPIIIDRELAGAIGLVLPVEALQQSEEDEMDFVRQASHYVAPTLARIRELDVLRANQAETDSLKAIAEMQHHLQSNVAHELRTPLATVRGYTRMILDGRAGEIAPTQREYLTIVTENANRLIHLVNWMSHLLQLGQQHLKIGSADLKEIWLQCVSANQDQIAEKRIALTQQIAAETFMAVCDREKIQSVFNSLLANAVKSTPPDGRISVEFSRGRQREFTFKITDNGQGLSPEELNLVFERHFGSSARGLVQSGFTGVYDIIGLHGGRLFVNSKTGEGSTFLFTLPPVRQDSEEHSSDDQTVNFGRRRR